MTDQVVEIVRAVANKMDVNVLPMQMLKMGMKRIGNDNIYIDSTNNMIDIQTVSNDDMSKIRLELTNELKKINYRLDEREEIKSNHIIFQVNRNS